MKTAAMKLKDACLFEEKPIHFFKWRHNFAENVQYNQSYDFSSCHVWMWQLHHKEWWVMNNWQFWTVVLDKNLESPLHCKEIHPVMLKEINPEYSLEGQMLIWTSNTLANWFEVLTHKKDPVTGKDWRQDKRMTEDEMVGWNHQLHEHEYA